MFNFVFFTDFYIYKVALTMLPNIILDIYFGLCFYALWEYYYAFTPYQNIHYYRSYNATFDVAFRPKVG